MNSDWASFLQSTDAVTSVGANAEQLNFAGDQQPASTECLCDLSADALLHVTGEDAGTFLQGQFSNDVQQVTPQTSQLSTWSTPKGRVLLLFRLYKVADGFLIRMPAAQVDTVVKRLRMYVLRAKVQIDVVSDRVVIGVSGEAAAGVLADSIGSLPAAVDETVVSDELLITRVRSAMPAVDVPRYEIVGPVDSIQRLWRSIATVAQVCSQARWRLQNIDAGVPAIGNDTAEAFVLQMLNLQHIDGVSFEKGCYPGQEVVARMQYLGKLKRRMYRAAVKGEPPAPGADIFAAGANSAVGKVVDAQHDGNGESRLLAVLAIESASALLTVGKEGDQQLQLLELPYNIPVDD